MRILLIVFLVLSFNSICSQNNYELISSNESLSNDEKDNKFDTLLRRYGFENKFDSLVIETYEVIKWNRKVGNLDKAINLNRKNLALMDSINYSDKLFYRRNLFSLGFYEARNNEISNALRTFKLLLNYNEPDEYSLKGTFEIAQIYFTEDNCNKSLEYYKLSRLLAKELNDDSRLTRSTIGIGRSNLVINTNKSIAEAISLTSETIQYLENGPKVNVADKYLAEIYKLLGNLYSDRSDYNFELATYNLGIALDIAEKTNHEIEIRNINNDLGLIHLKDKRPEAEQFFKKALTYWTDNVTYGLIRRNLAQYYLDNKKTALALESIHKSIEALNKKRTDSFTELPKKERLKSSRFKNQMISSLTVKADVWLQLAKENINKSYYYEQSIKTIELCDWLIDLARLSDIEYKSKLVWQKKTTALYILAIELYDKINRPKDAFYYFEKNKAIQLLEDVNLKSTRANTNIPTAISDKEKALRIKVIDLEEQYTNSPTEAISRDLIIAKEDYNRYINALDPEIKLLYKLEQPTNVIDLESFRDQHLSSKEVYIEYLIDDEQGYGLFVSKDKSILFKIDSIDKLKDLINNYRNLLETPMINKDRQTEFNTASHDLYNILLPEGIRDDLNQKKLTIIPDYYLQNIPFEPLITSIDDNKSYLIFQNEINYSYSITFLTNNRTLVKANSSKLVGFAPVNFNDSLPSLTNTKEELKILNELSSSDIFFNKEATKDNFYKISEDAQIVHIASHANASDAISPWIAFSDEKLHLNELYNHNTSADLIVLSACNTSLGEVYKGEGVLSLARGFFYSGSQSVLTSLWTVNDKSTSFLMEDFYTNLKKGESKSEALRNAKLNYINSHSLSEASPYYWSSFVLLGDAGKIDIQNGFSIWHYSILGLIILTVLFLVLKFKKK